MNFKVDFDIDGFTEQLEQEALRVAREHLRENVEEKLRAVRCPDHPVAAQVVVNMTQLEGGEISATPCCDKVADQVRASLESAGDRD